MTSFVQRSPHAPGAEPATPAARNAALLIDFDNITLGVRSDLGKELRTLLNSEIFSGKVAVRRAYADWRRYPNYVVPLTEASVDLIFAPAYGTSKKNATDLRMAVDAIELAFMRPELGTFILLTGDSDFTSCVVKLKEYGKYVIGVGMRDSSSDLLIQNCDEYYSYHALSGLVREGDQGGIRKDPWLLVREAVQKMAAANDSMRTDRLKQVMIDLDPNFDEKDEGYSKFSKFVQVAAEKGLIRLHKVENGQFEVAPADDEAPLPAPQARYDRGGEDRYRDRDRDRERGRGGRGRGRDRDRDRGPQRDYPQPIGGEAEQPVREEPSRPEPAPVRLHRDEEERAPEPVHAAAEVAPYEPAGPPLHEEEPAPPTPAERDARTHAYALLQHAVRALVSRQGQTARDGDVKRRMLEMDPGFDEHTLGYSKFSRFLRQAHEDQVVDVRRLAEGRYEVALPSAGTKLAPPTLASGPRPQPIHVEHDDEAQAADTAASAEPRRDRGRGRGRARGGAEGSPAILPGQAASAEPARPAEPAQPTAEAPRPEAPQPRREPEPRRPEPGAPATPPAPPPSGGAAEAPRGMGHRNRGRRPAWASPSGPPPLLPGQVIHIPGSSRPAPEPHSEPQREVRAEEPSAPAAESAAPAETRPPSRRDRRPGRAPAAEAPRPEAPPAFDPASLGLPTDRAGIEAHLAGYRGVGGATVRSLVDRFGDGVFQALEEDPDGIRTLLGHRAGPLLGKWAADRDARIAARPAPAVPAPAEEAAPEPAAAEVSDDARDFAEAASAVAPEPEQDGAGEPYAGGETEEHRSRRRGRRGGRNRSRRGGGDEAGASAEGAETTLADVSPRAAAEEAAVEQAAAIDHSSLRGGEVPAAETISVEGIELPVGDGGETDPTLMEPVTRPAGEPQPRGRSRGRGRRGGGVEVPAAETISVEGIELPVGDGGETDPTLMEPATRPAGEAQPRGRSRGRGGRGRGARTETSAEGGEVSASRAEAEVPRAEPTSAPAESAPAEGDRPSGRSRRGRGRAAEPAAPAPTPVAEEAPAGGGNRRGRGARGGAKPVAEAPAPKPPAAEGGRARTPGGRRAGGTPTKAAPPAPEPDASGGEEAGAAARPRRNRGRGGRGRGTGPAAS
ncbi:MAG TPA: NYN domain-containing protein [Longimicrobium sp.]|nr:NYN domain-containing protein [Longimicrobium sp.]